MLNAMREGTGAHIVKYVALGFVLLASLGMIFMDVGGVFTNGIGTDRTLAKIGGVKIDQAQFERTATPSLRAQNMTMQEAYRFGLLQGLLEEMAAREAMRQEAVKEGILVSRDEIAKRVYDLTKAQLQPGETPQQALTRVLQAQGWTEADLLQGIRQDLIGLLMQRPIAASTHAVPNLISEALGRFQAERRDIVFFTLTPEGVGADIKADEESLRTYYDTVKDQYQLPEERTFKTLVLSAEDVKSNVRTTDADVQAAYNERKDQFRIGERRKIEQIVLQDEEKAKAASEAARKGKSLKGLSANTYREPVETEQAALTPELASAVFGAKKASVLNPIKTPLGWHVVRVISITPARTQSLAEVRDNLRKELESDALHSEMEDRIAKVDEILGSGETLEKAAEEMGLAIRTVGPIDAHGNFQQGETQDALLTALSSNKDLLSSIFELMEGETGDLAEVNEGLYAAFSLENVRPTRDREFTEVRDQIEKKWLDEQRANALNAAVESVMADLSAGKKDFATAAKESGAVLKTARDVSRQSKVAGLNDPVALTRLFDETDLSAVVKVPTEQGVILARVIDARIPDAGAGNMTKEAKDQLHTQTEQAITSLVLAQIRERNNVKINVKNLEKIYGAEADEK